jgi:NTP pyrophosphatase (non-canonical NTP hydrolase)
MNEIQEKLKDWLEENFRLDLTDSELIIQQLAGMIEETGELTHSILKSEQGIRKNENHIENIYDAIGDILIFMSNFLYLLDIDIEKRMTEPRKKVNVTYKFEYIFKIVKELNVLIDYIETFFISTDYQNCLSCEDYKECEKNFSKSINKCIINICDVLQSILNVYFQPVKLPDVFKTVSSKVLNRDWNKHREEHGN